MGEGEEVKFTRQRGSLERSSRDASSVYAIEKVRLKPWPATEGAICVSPDRTHGQVAKGRPARDTVFKGPKTSLRRF
jgi:hypothetical protein